jgi:hypothetical protein
MSLKFKKTMDLELVNDVPVGANVLIETDYATKRLPVTAINNGYSKEECDEKFMASDAKTSWNDLQDKPFYEETKVVNEPLNITWDGNTDGLVNVLGQYFKVSDSIFTDEQIKLMTITTNDESMTPAKIGDIWDEALGEGVFPSADATHAAMICVARKDGAILSAHDMEVVFPEKGLYFAKFPNSVAVTSLTTTEPIEYTKTTVKKLDKKYLPNNIGGGKVLKIIRSDFGNYLSEVSTMISAGYTYETNMTLEEARAAFRACELDGVVFYKGNARIDMYYSAEALSNSGVVYFVFACMFMDETIEIFWSEEYGITNSNPYVSIPT